jgi:site-specific DNA-cytosine methylase
MRVLDLFAGTGSATKAFEDAGHEVIKVELDDYFEAHERDILKLTADYLKNKYGQFDFIWASPPCTTFSVASIRHYWNYEDGKAIPKNDKTLHGIELVKKTIALIQALNPKHGYVIENPRGMLRKQDVVKDLRRTTITYCQYGAKNQKPTDLWNTLKNWTPRQMCKAGSTCHNSAKRGSDTGTQGMGGGGKHGAVKRSMIPYELGKEILESIMVNNK